MKRISILLPALLFVATQASSQTAELKKLAQTAFTHAPRMLETEQSVKIQEERSKYMKTYLLPSIGLSGTYTYVDPVAKVDFPVAPGETKALYFQPNNNFSTAITANYVVLDFGRARLGIQKAMEELNQSKYAQESARVQLASQVAQLYYGLAYLQQAIRVQDSLITYLEENKGWTQSRLKQGDAIRLDLLNVENLILQEKNRKAELIAQKEKQTALLRYASGESLETVTTDFGFVSDVSSLTNAGANAAEQNGHPDFLLSKSRIEQSKIEDENARRQFFPLLSVTLGGGFRNGYQPDIYENRFNWLGGLSLTAPLFSGGRYYRQQTLGKLSTKLAQQGLESWKAGNQRDYESAQADFRSAESKIPLGIEQEKIATEALQLANSRYKNGISTQSDVLTVLSQWHRARLNSVNLQYQKCLSLIELSRVIGYRWW